MAISDQSRPPARSQFRNTPLVVLALGANGGSRLVINLLVGTLAGPAALGVFQSGFSGAQLAALAWPTAVGSAASAYLAKSLGKSDPDLLRDVNTHLRLRTIQSTVAITVVATALWVVLSRTSPLVAAGFAAVTIGVCCYGFTRGRLYGLGEIKRAVFWDVTTSVITVTISGVALLLHAGTGILLLCTAVNYLIFAVATWPRDRSSQVAVATARELDKFTLFAVLGTVASSGFLQASLLVSGVVGGPEAAGYFGAAFTLATPMTLMSTGIALVLFPHLARAVGRNDAGARRRTADISTRILALVMVPAYGIVIILTRWIIETIWGPRFAPAAVVLPYISFAIMLTTVAIPAVNLITSESSRGARESATFSSIGLAIGCSTWSFLIPLMGLQGVACGYMIGTTVSAVIPFVVSWRRTGQQWSWLTVRIMIAIALLAAALAVQHGAADSTRLDFLLAGIFVVLWILLELPEVRELFMLVRRSIRTTS